MLIAYSLNILNTEEQKSINIFFITTVFQFRTINKETNSYDLVKIPNLAMMNIMNNFDGIVALEKDRKDYLVVPDYLTLS